MLLTYSRRDPNRFYKLTFLTSLLLQLVLVWWFRYFPSADGPSHLFNSYVFLNYHEIPVFRDAFTVQIPPAGNLTGHGLVIALMRCSVPPQICEKLVMTACILGLALAFSYAVTAIRSAHAAAPLLVFPFLYNLPMQMGFWSFSLGVPFVLVCIGLCLRHNSHWNLRSLSLLFLTVAAAYACHPLSWAACGLIVALMVITSEYRSLLVPSNRSRGLRQILLPVLIFVPFAIPNFLFARENGFVLFDRIKSLSTLLWPLYTADPVRLFAADMRPARVLFLILVLATFANLAWRRQQKFSHADVLLFVSLFLFCLALFSPERIGEGTFIGVRFLLFGFLVLSAWLAVTLPKPLIQITAVLTLLISAWLSLGRLPSWEQANLDLSTVARFGNEVAANSFVCQISERTGSENVFPLDHAIDLWTPRHTVDVLDYEAGRKAFWTRFRPGYYLDEDFFKPASRSDFEGAMKRFEQHTGKKLDYILVTNSKRGPQPALQHLLPTLWPGYKLLASGPSDIYLFRRESPS